MPSPFSWQEVSRRFPVESCVRLCKRGRSKGSKGGGGEGRRGIPRFGSEHGQARDDGKQESAQEAGMAFSKRRTSRWCSSESAAGRRGPNLAQNSGGTAW